MAYEKEIEELKKEEPIAVVKVPEEIKEEVKSKQEGISIPVVSAKDPIWKNKKIMAAIGVVLLIIACAGGYLYSQEQKKQQILDSIQIAFIEDPVIEYGDTDFDYGTLIKQKTDEVILPDPIDSMQTGEFEVVYKVEKEGYTKEFPLKIEVKDTKAPVITFKNDTVSLEVGSEFKAADNIKSVVDPIDGDIAFAEAAGENNYYVIEGSVDTAAAGEYTITIKAVDKNGNEAEKAFKVEVKEKAADPVNNTGGGNSYYQQPSYSAGGNAGSSGSNGGGSSSGNANTCTFQYYVNLGNSGRTFSSAAEANAWAKAQRNDDTSPWSYNNGYNGNTGWTVRDNCGVEHNDVWTVNFY